MEKISFRGRSQHSEPIQESPYRPASTKPKPDTSNMPLFQQFKASLNWKPILLSLAVWLFVVNYLERSFVKRTIQKCHWDNWEQWDSDPHRIALFADPQIMDDFSYPGRPALLNYLGQKYLDNYHRRNWDYVDYVLDSDTIIFLGDLFDGGREWEDDYWLEEFKRFNSIYHKIPDKQIIMNLPGNHDIGFGETINVKALNRFRAYFGETSSIHNIGNHTIVLLDTISASFYSNEDVNKQPREIMDQLAPLNPNDPPRILMTHVPLYRDPTHQPCGPLRETKNKFPLMKGVQYQTAIDHELSQEVLAKVRPKIIFGGDDHDYCHVTHTYGASNTAEEITVKSCAMNMGVKRPAIQLLSLNTKDGNTKTYQTEMCYLPDPYFTLKTHALLAVSNIALFFLVYLFPKQWNLIVKQVKNYIPKQTLGLPIAQSVKQVRFENYKKRWNEFLINGSITTFGVFFIFHIYFGAFY